MLYRYGVCNTGTGRDIGMIGDAGTAGDADAGYEHTVLTDLGIVVEAAAGLDETVVPYVDIRGEDTALTDKNALA